MIRGAPPFQVFSMTFTKSRARLKAKLKVKTQRKLQYTKVQKVCFLFDENEKLDKKKLFANSVFIWRGVCESCETAPFCNKLKIIAIPPHTFLNSKMFFF